MKSTLATELNNKVPNSGTRRSTPEENKTKSLQNRDGQYEAHISTEENKMKPSRGEQNEAPRGKQNEVPPHRGIT